MITLIKTTHSSIFYIKSCFKGVCYSMKIFFIVNVGKRKAVEKAKDAILFLKKFGCQCAVEREKVDLFDKQVAGKTLDEIHKFDFIIAVGGDGTVLAASEYALKYDIPILGINAGHLGFLCGLEYQNLKKLSRIFSGEYAERRRMLLEVEYGAKKYIAVNDAVFVKPVLGSLIDLKIFEKSNFIIEYRADSVLFSTPTGSTAYALSNGGPISDPNLNFISMSPICAHSLISRTYLFSDNAELVVEVGKKDQAHLVLDGVDICLLNSGDRVKIRKSEKRLRLVYLKDIPFFELVRKKFLPK